VEDVIVVLNEIVLSPAEPLPLELNPAAIYLSTLRASGRTGMQQSLKLIVETLTGQPGDILAFPWHQLRYQHAQAIRTALTEAKKEDGTNRFKPNTVNHALAALRGVLNQAENLELLSGDDYRRISKVKSIKHSQEISGRALKTREITALLKVCAKDTTPAGTRDGALVAVAYTAGLRRSEISTLDLSDYDPESGELKVRGGKGGKDRTTYLSGGSAEALSGWLKLRGQEAGPLFYPINKGGNLVPHRFTAQAVLKILRKRQLEAGIKKFSPHDLRRTFITDLLAAGADIATVQKLAGHANVSTTTRYDRRGEEAKKKAAALLNVSYPAGNNPGS